MVFAKGELTSHHSELQEQLEERRLRISEIMLKGITGRAAISRRLREDYGIEVSEQTVSKDLLVLKEEFRLRMVDNIEAHMSLDLARIETAIGALYNDWASGDNNAINTLIKLLERKAKMLGYDQSVKVDITHLLVKIAEKTGLDAKKFIEDSGLIIDADEFFTKEIKDEIINGDITDTEYLQ